MLPGERQHRGASRLHWLLAEHVRDRGLSEGNARDTVGLATAHDLAFSVRLDEVAECGIEYLGIEHDDAEQVRCERQRVHTDTEAIGPHSPAPLRITELHSEGPLLIVDRTAVRLLLA